jgi:hypothetical protein
MPPAHLYQKAVIEKKEGNIEEVLNPSEEDEEQKRERDDEEVLQEQVS